DIGLRYFFFFQAEDGIRDYKVTGVQTCALPICSYGTTLQELVPAGRLVARATHRGTRFDPVPEGTNSWRVVPYERRRRAPGGNRDLQPAAAADCAPEGPRPSGGLEPPRAPRPPCLCAAARGVRQP